MFSLDPLGQRMQQVGLQKTDLQVGWFHLDTFMLVFDTARLVCKTCAGTCNREQV